MKSAARAHEVNFDCIVGPTHHFGGLSVGNLASTKNRARLSNPKQAALQGLQKMRFLHTHGFVQGALPPHARPHLQSFRNLGFSGRDEEIMRTAFHKMPSVFSRLCSSSAMWAANAATVSPSFDSRDGLVHLSPANLVTMLHRSIEADFTHRVFRAIFSDEKYFAVHPPLPAHDTFADEGAANHNRLCPHHGMQGLQIFVYGKISDSLNAFSTKKYPARQAHNASLALAQRHQLSDDHVLLIAQNPDAIDHGAFHNDVVAVTNQNLLLCHERAFCDQKNFLIELRARYEKLFGEPPVIIEISDQDLPLDDAVSSYLFNSQLLTKPDNTMLLFAPSECSTNAHACALIQKLIEDKNPVNEVCYFNVSESMANGGGPACLRLRVLLTDEEIKALKGNVVVTDAMFESLTHIIERYYVENLTMEHFFDASFLRDCQHALDEIAVVLKLERIYDFQQ